MTACKQQDKKEEKAPEATTTTTAPFINPPIKGADVPYEEYDVDAAKGDTIVYPSGSIILFPPNAFVDEAGRPVTGNVQVKYREFKDPIDFFLAGIPMSYDSAGVAYQFESSGMFDIRAFKDDKPVFVNKERKPEVNLASKNKSDKHSLYFLDTVQGKWLNKGGMQITERRSTKKTNRASTVIATEELPEPVKPLKADNKSPVLKIEVDPSSFKEFAIYKNLKFQVDESKTRFNTKDSEEEWNNLELLKGSQPGTYLAKFSNAGKTVTYAVKPVFTGSDYDNAVKAFENEYAVYKKQAQVRAAKDKALREKYTKDSIENDQLIIKNKELERLNATIAKKNRQTEVVNREGRQLYLSLETLGDVYRTVGVENFGVWNCDLAVRPNANYVRATYKDEKGNIVQLSYVASIVKGLNSIFRTNSNEVSIIPGADHMILGVCNNQIAYLTFNEFKKLNITADTKEVTFVMKIVEEANTNYQYIRSLFKQ
jgi:hypothetical protein